MVRWIIPSVGGEVKLERRCPDCGRGQGQVHTAIRYRRISDVKVSAIAQRRMRCPWCGLSWTLRAEGVGAGCQRSRRLVVTGVVLYMLGLSYRSVEKFLPLMGCRGGKSSIERDVKAAGETARSMHRAAPGLRVRVVGADGTGASMAGVDQGLLFLVDVDGERLVAVEAVAEEDAEAVRRHVGRVFAEVGAEELRSDEHSSYRGIVPEGAHRLCLTHWGKSKGKRARDLLGQAEAENRRPEIETLKRLVELLRQRPRPPNPPEELEAMVGRYLPCRRGLLWGLNQLLQHVERTWSRVSDDPKDPTNNTTERLIGLTYKIRTKTMRGMKSLAKVLTHPYLASFLRGVDGVCDLRQIA